MEYFKGGTVEDLEGLVEFTGASQKDGVRAFLVAGDKSMEPFEELLGICLFPTPSEEVQRVRVVKFVPGLMTDHYLHILQLQISDPENLLLGAIDNRIQRRVYTRIARLRKWPTHVLTLARFRGDYISTLATIQGISAARALTEVQDGIQSTCFKRVG